MRSLFSAIFPAAWVIASLAQTPAVEPGQADKKQPDPCTVSGRVVTAAEGAPIKAARVGLVERDARRQTHIFATFTDNDGRFEIKKINPGRYEFAASHSGYISQRYQSHGTSAGAILTLAPGQEVNEVLFRPVRAAVVTGRVIDEAGEPMVGVTVSVLQKPSAEELEEASPKGKKQELSEMASGTTDDRGEYRVFGLKPGDYYIRATETDRQPWAVTSDGVDWTIQQEVGNQHAPLYYPGAVQPDQAQAVSLRAGEEVQADFAMRHIKTVKILGRVIAADGSPATHASVDLSAPDVGDWSRMSAGTDDKGEFTIKGVPPGSYILSARQRDEDKHYEVRQKLEVGEEKLGSITLAFARGVTISGHVITANAGGTALDRIRLYLSPIDDDEGIPAWAGVNKDGSFQLKDVADGGYVLHISLMEQGWFVKSARQAGEDVYQKGVQLEKGASAGSLEIVLSSDGARLEGSVTDKDHDQPIAGARVQLKLEPQTPYNRGRGRIINTDQNGHFTFDSLPPGKYRLVARLPSATPEVPAINSEPQIVTLGEHEHEVVQLKLALPQAD
jgi:protocatechuate 3,4-dioxygenase beta subunit